MLPITVVIPNYKQDQWVTKAWQSAFDSVNDIMVHDDDTQSWRAGVCYARNIMIQDAKEDLILCLDADDRLYPHALQSLYEQWQPGTWVYPAAYDEIDENENVLCTRETPPPGMIYRKNLCYSTFLFHRDDWIKTGGYNPTFEPLEEDYAFQCALVHHGVKAVRSADMRPMYQRMLHEHSRTSEAMPLWNITQQLCRRLYPNAFI